MCRGKRCCPAVRAIHGCNHEVGLKPDPHSLKHDFDWWQNQALSDMNLLYLFCDGICPWLPTRRLEGRGRLVRPGSSLTEGSCCCIGSCGIKITPATMQELDS